MSKPIYIATRGSALALAQSNAVLAQCRAAFPELTFALSVIKTTGDKLQTASLANPDASLPKGLFTKELEVALLDGSADLAVHSLKDLPTELPTGLKLGAVGKRADVRDVLIYRDLKFLESQPSALRPEQHANGQKDKLGLAAGSSLKDFPAGAVIATSSTRRQSQLLAARPDLKTVEIRGNVPTRLQRLMERSDVDAIVLAAAGLERLHFTINKDSKLTGEGIPDGLLAVRLELDLMLPCVGQGAIGIETRADDSRIDAICDRLNHFETHQCVLAERAFLRTMGGGCQSPVAAYAEIAGKEIRMRAVSFRSGPGRTTAGKCPIPEAEELGKQLAEKLSA
jgi:hydroxymethylbilane synthase